MEDVASYPAQRESEEPLRFLLSDCANAHERDLLIIWRALGHWHEPPGTVEDVLESIRLLRAERRQLRARLVECRPWVGACPYPNTPGFTEMMAIRDLADDTLAEVKE